MAIEKRGQEPLRRAPDPFDVVVAGGGPGGVCAAAAAAKRGAKVLLIERYGFLGGMATAGLVNPFMNYMLGQKRLSTAVFNEIIDRLDAKGGLGRDRHTFDDEILKSVLDEMMATYRVKVALHTFLGGAETADGKIAAVRLEEKGGSRKVSARIFVDSTGDGDLAAAAGAKVELGRPADGNCQPMTLCFRIGNVAGAQGEGLDRGSLRKELTEIYIKAKERGEIQNPREDVLIFSTLIPGLLHFNTTRIVGRPGVDSEGLGTAEVEGRRQALELFELFKRESPSFKNAYLAKVACQIGVRETRRVMGAYVLTEEDVLKARKFEDGIARSNYPIDIHNPAGTGTVIRSVAKGDYYEVPYRCLTPNGVWNLLIGSRCISATHEAHSSLRVMPVVAGIGEAAGAAAAKAAAANFVVSQVDGKELKKELLG